MLGRRSEGNVSCSLPVPVPLPRALCWQRLKGFFLNQRGGCWSEVGVGTRWGSKSFGPWDLTLSTAFSSSFQNWADLSLSLLPLIPGALWSLLVMTVKQAHATGSMQQTSHKRTKGGVTQEKTDSRSTAPGVTVTAQPTAPVTSWELWGFLGSWCK